MSNVFLTNLKIIFKVKVGVLCSNFHNFVKLFVCGEGDDSTHQLREKLSQSNGYSRGKNPCVPRLSCQESFVVRVEKLDAS